MTWNTGIPVSTNSVASDVTKMNENFTHLWSLVGQHWKTISTTTTSISKDSIYFVDPAAADQGATTNSRSIKSIVDAVGATKKAILWLPHQSADGNSTTYTVTTAITATSNFTIIAENGVIVAGAAALTVDGTMINLGALTITGTVVVSATGYLMDLGPVTETGTLTMSGFRLTSVVSASAASAADVNTGTSTSVFITPYALANSDYGETLDINNAVNSYIVTGVVDFGTPGDISWVARYVPFPVGKFAVKPVNCFMTVSSPPGISYPFTFYYDWENSTTSYGRVVFRCPTGLPGGLVRFGFMFVADCASVSITDTAP